MVEVELENILAIQEEECYSSNSEELNSLNEDEPKEINALTKGQEFLFDVIYKLPDDEEKKIYHQKFKPYLEKPTLQL